MRQRLTLTFLLLALLPYVAKAQWTFDIVSVEAYIHLFGRLICGLSEKKVLSFSLERKERTKENCRCFDAADPRLGGCTPLRTPKRRSRAPWAKRKQYLRLWHDFSSICHYGIFHKHL